MTILLCMFDSRASLPKEVKNDIEDFLKNARGGNSAWANAQMLPTYIRRNIKLAEAPSYGKTIFEYENDCNGAKDYHKVAEFIAQMGKEGIGAEQDTPGEAAPEPLQATEPVDREIQDTVERAEQDMPAPQEDPQPQVEILEIAQVPSEPAPIKILEFEELHKSSRKPESQVHDGPSVSHLSSQERPKRIPPESNHSAW